MKQLRINLLLLLASLIIALSIFEVTIRFAVQPSDRSWGRLAGLELPPLKLLREIDEEDIDRSAPYRDLVVGDQGITRGDLWGLIREDEELGYVSVESGTSVNGWWQSNAVGARSRNETTHERPPGVLRALVFGESFTMGSRVRQEESWPHHLGEKVATLDVVNFAVDGYSMAQSFLRYRRVREQLDHDIVILGFVPREDLIREVNTMRSLIGWESSILVPRFRLDHGELSLVSRPFRTAQEARSHTMDGGGDRLEGHLRSYDPTYFPKRYTVPPIVGDLMAYKLAAAIRYSRQDRRLDNSLMQTDSEAVRTVRAIFDTMAAEVHQRGQRFVLAYIPTRLDIRDYRDSAAYRDRWDGVVAHCPVSAVCIDLQPHLSGSDLDRGYDGTHYGPNTNALLADAVWSGLREMLPFSGEATPHAPGSGPR